MKATKDIFKRNVCSLVLLASTKEGFFPAFGLFEPDTVQVIQNATEL